MYLSSPIHFHTIFHQHSSLVSTKNEKDVILSSGEFSITSLIKTELKINNIIDICDSMFKAIQLYFINIQTGDFFISLAIINCLNFSGMIMPDLCSDLFF